jgi:3-oxoacyl-[acyl-carrier protein] reductase
MDLDLTGRCALVCGASAGIGAATAAALASAGARVFAVARRAERLLDLVDSLPGSGHRALALDLDARSEFLAAVRGLLDEGAIEICVNNTGGPPAGALLDAEPALFEKTFARHVLVAHELARLLVPGMKARGYGRIVNVISTSVYEPIPGLGVSNTIRGAMASWAKSLADELPPGITVNNVLPGFTDTERLASLADAKAARSNKTREDIFRDYTAQIPEGRLARPEETAAAILFLASPAAAYVRGVSLPVDGGRLRGI